MSDKRLSGSIALTKLPQSIILEKKGKSGIIRGVFLPIEGNNLLEKDGAVYMNVSVLVREEQDQYGQNGFISKALPSEVYKEKKDDADWVKEQQPILGNIKDWTSSSASGGSVESYEEEDTLPF